MKMEKSTRIYKSCGIEEDHTNINKFCRAVLLNFGDDRGDIVVENDNFGTRRKYADFTNGKKKAGLHPLQIVFSGIDNEHFFGTKYIDANENIKIF